MQDESFVPASIDPAGNVAFVGSEWLSRPDSFGRDTEGVSMTAFPHVFAGLELLPGSGGYQLSQSRLFDGSVGRFARMDPLGVEGGPSRFTYAENDPTSLWDPAGLSAEGCGQAQLPRPMGGEPTEGVQKIEGPGAYVDTLHEFVDVEGMLRRNEGLGEAALRREWRRKLGFPPIGAPTPGVPIGGPVRDLEDLKNRTQPDEPVVDAGTSEARDEVELIVGETPPEVTPSLIPGGAYIEDGVWTIDVQDESFEALCVGDPSESSAPDPFTADWFRQQMTGYLRPGAAQENPLRYLKNMAMGAVQGDATNTAVPGRSVGRDSATAVLMIATTAPTPVAPIAAIVETGTDVRDTAVATDEFVENPTVLGGLGLAVEGIGVAVPLGPADSVGELGSKALKSGAVQNAVVELGTEVADAAIEYMAAKGGTYKLVDPETGQVMRTGRSNDLDRRKGEHARDPAHEDPDFEVDRRTDDYAQQRGREQVIHDAHDPPLDRIEPIAPTNPRRGEYLNAARDVE